MNKEELIQSLIPDALKNSEIQKSNYDFYYKFYESLIDILSSEFRFYNYKIKSFNYNFIFHIYGYEEDPLNEFYGYVPNKLPNQITYIPGEDEELPDDGQVIFIPRLRKDGELSFDSIDICNHLIREKQKKFIIMKNNEFLVLKFDSKKYATIEVKSGEKMTKLRHPVYEIWKDKYGNKYSMEYKLTLDDDLIIFKQLQNDKDECNESVRSGIDHESD